MVSAAASISACHVFLPVPGRTGIEPALNGRKAVSGERQAPMAHGGDPRRTEHDGSAQVGAVLGGNKVGGLEEDGHAVLNGHG